MIGGSPSVAVDDVAGNADNRLPRRSRRRNAPLYSLADRVLPWPVAFRERTAHDGGPAVLEVFLGQEPASSHDGDAERLEVVAESPGDRHAAGCVAGGEGLIGREGSTLTVPFEREIGLDGDARTDGIARTRSCRP